MTVESTHVKVLFRFYSDLLEKETVETMWAKAIDSKNGLYILDSIPFYAPNIASKDLIFAEYNQDEKMLTYKETVEYSGNSTIQVVILNEKIIIEDLRNILRSHGCTTEKLNDKYFVIDVPAMIDYYPIRKILQEHEDAEDIGYAEPCLSDSHRN